MLIPSLIIGKIYMIIELIILLYKHTLDNFVLFHSSQSQIT